MRRTGLRVPRVRWPAGWLAALFTLAPWGLRLYAGFVLPRLPGRAHVGKTTAHAQEVDDDYANEAVVAAAQQSPALPLPRHPANAGVNAILERTEALIDRVLRGDVRPPLQPPSSSGRLFTSGRRIGAADKVYVNSYVDLGTAEVFGFDYDYTLVGYKPALQDMIYEMARERLVEDLQYPKNLTEDLKGYDHEFAIRGIAVDLESAWICTLTNRYRVSIAFYGRERVPDDQVRKMYTSVTGAGILPPEERRRRMRPLNDLFSTVEACLLADVVQWFKERRIPFDPQGVVTDVLSAVGAAHTSGAMHRAVAEDLERFVEPDEEGQLRRLLERLQGAGKKTMLVSNSPFWYVDAGMSHKVGPHWRGLFDAVIVCAGKPSFYTQNKPFREVSKRTGRVKFKPIQSIEKDEVYCAGSITELMRLTGWVAAEDGSSDGSKVIYLGDSLFADLVDARRLYGWTTGAIISEVRQETLVHGSAEWRLAWHVLQALVHCMRLCQEEMGLEGVRAYSPEDHGLLDELEELTAEQRRRQDRCMNPNFGSIFRTSKDHGRTATPSLFARSLQRHVDFYTSRVENLRFYSTDHRFYPSDSRLGILHESTHMTDSILQLLVGPDEEASSPLGFEAEDYSSW